MTAHERQGMLHPATQAEIEDRLAEHGFETWVNVDFDMPTPRASFAMVGAGAN